MKYKRKPIVVEAWQFTKENYKEGIPKTFKDENILLWSRFNGHVFGGEITTIEDVVRISENDFIIKDINGEFYTCKPDVFEMTYEKAE